MKIKILYIVIVMLLLIDIFLLHSLIHSKSNKQSIEDVGEMKVKQLIELSSVKDEAKIINKNCILLDDKSDEVFLFDLLTKNSLLILKISKLNCNTCIDQSIELLKLFVEEYGIEGGKIVILYQDSNLRDLTLLKKSIGNKIPVYQIKDQDSLNMNMDQLNIPYFFILDSNYTPKILHVADKKFPDFTRQYFDVVYENFFNMKSQ